VAANIYVYCPAGADGLSRCDLEAELEAFFGGAAEDCGAGSGIKGFNLDYELADVEDPDTWAERLKPFLAAPWFAEFSPEGERLAEPGVAPVCGGMT
jgi:hypothetical protein